MGKPQITAIARKLWGRGRRAGILVASIR